MQAAHLWARRYEISDRPWLILGKGPSFAKFKPVDAEGAFVLALNHVSRTVACDAALMMDWEVFDACADALAANAEYALMPWRPHVKFRPGAKTLADFVVEDARLARLDDERRLIVFNARTASAYRPYPGEPITDVRFFSAEAALNLLADNGAKIVRTLGVDGGASYAPDFNDVASKTLLANGAPSFDRQFERFARTLMRHPALDFAPLDMAAPVRVFIGADETQKLAARVLEYSIRRHASLSVHCELIDNAGLAVPADPARRARTGFSFSRFKIPALCNHAGRAIYLDADMLVFADIKDLWARDFGESWLLFSEFKGETRKPQYSVMLLDCARLGWDAHALVAALDSGEFDYKTLMHDFAMMPGARKSPGLEFEWNSLEHYENGRTKLLHYTDMPLQPWVSARNPNRRLWLDALRDAAADGFITRAEIDAEIEKGHISPLLPKWAGLKPRFGAAWRARLWQAPFQRLAAASPS